MQLAEYMTYSHASKAIVNQIHHFEWLVKEKKRVNTCKNQQMILVVYCLTNPSRLSSQIGRSLPRHHIKAEPAVQAAFPVASTGFDQRRRQCHGGFVSHRATPSHHPF